MVDESVKEYINKLEAIETEIGLLREDMKDLDAEYKEKIDVKAVKAAIRIVKIKAKSDENLVDDVIKIIMSLEG